MPLHTDTARRPALAGPLAPLARGAVFQSRSRQESQRALTQHLIGHQLRWGRGDIDTSLHRRELDRISLLVLQYGAEVEVSPQAFPDFALVQMPLRGQAQIACDGLSLRMSPGEVVVVPPQRQVRLLWEPGCQQLIVKVPSTLLRPADCGDCPARPCPADRLLCAPWTDPVFKLPPEISGLWRTLLQQLVALLPGEAAVRPHPQWLAHFEQTAALFLQAHQPSLLQAAAHPASQRPDGVPGAPWPDGAPGAQRAHGTPGAARAHGVPAAPRVDAMPPALERLEQYIRSRLCAPLALTDLVRAAGVTTRTLNQLCHRHRGVAPMALLRNLRLDAARTRLLAGTGESVTEVALAHGFAHFGRFSAYYRERFGELPSRTTRAFN